MLPNSLKFSMPRSLLIRLESEDTIIKAMNRTKRFGFILTVFVLAPFFCPFPMEAAENGWPHQRGPNNDGTAKLQSMKTDWSSGLSKSWELNALCEGDPTWSATMSSPVVYDGILVCVGRKQNVPDDPKIPIPTGSDIVFGIEAVSGKILWRQEYETPKQSSKKLPKDVGTGARATPFIDPASGFVYTIGAYGDIACWELKSGKNIWRKNILDDSGSKVPYWGVCTSPIVQGDLAIFGYGGYDQGKTDGIVFAYDKNTGALKWKSPIVAAGSWGPALEYDISGVKQLLVWGKEGLFSLSPLDGSKIWMIPWKTAYDCNSTAPIVKDGMVFITSGYNAGCQAFSLQGSEIKSLWEKNKAISSCNSDPVEKDGFIYSFSGNGESGSLVCLELKSGKTVWEEKKLGNGTLLLIGDKLLCMSYKGKLALLNASPEKPDKIQEFTVFDRQKTPSAPKSAPCYSYPAIANDTIYLRHLEKICAYSLK